MRKFPTDRAMIWSSTTVLIVVVGALNLAKIDNRFLEATAASFVGAALGVSLPKKNGEI